MDTSFRTSSRRTYELPKPDADFADWTSKIKAIQRQVDADEDNEQKRLEEEIAAARQARLRRSHGGGAANHVDSADLSSRELVGVLGDTSDASDRDTPKSLADTYDDRETSLRKLMGRNNVYNPDKRGTSEGSSRPDSVSLASFIGGRATGPRLNRHAPQADAHDSTQYIQPDLSAPHPIFGTRGLAIPAKTAEREKSSASLIGSEMSERYRPASASALKPSFSSAVKDEVGKLELTKQEKVAANRRSFTTMAKSPPSALAQSYTNILDKSTPDTMTKGTQPLLIKRKSNGSIPKEPSLPSPSKGGGTSTISVSPSKSTNHLSSSSWKTSQSTPNPAASYLRTKTSSPFPAAKTGSNAHAGLPTSALNDSVHKSPSQDRGSTIPIPTYSLPRNEVSSSNHGITPLRRLMEKNSVYNPDKVQTNNFGKSVAERAQTTSLAAFMGGSGKGIRLNKHAPQADAHDPTQFIQPDLSTPHPIFGKGGVAMPGMVTQTNLSTLDSGIDSTGLSRPSLTKKAVWPPVFAPSKAEERSVSPQKIGRRARTISAPRPESSSSFGVSQASEPTSERSRSPGKGTLVGVPLRDRTTSIPPVTSPQPSIVTPALARPIQPQVKKILSLSPQLPATTASPAFNKPTTQKDLTPSLSKLQGRGFVQNMVKASSQISSTPSPPSPSPSRPASTTGKKGSVLNRWQSTAQTGSSIKSSPAFLSKATTGPGGSSYGLTSSASFPSLTKPVSSSPPKQVEAPYPRSRTPGLGSATTVVVIKPSKSFTDLTELGMRTATDSESSSPRKTSIYMARDKTRKSREVTNSCGMPRIDPQILTESSRKDEEDIFVPRSAPAWMGTFDLHSRDQKFNATSSSKVEATKFPTSRGPVVASPRHPDESADFRTPREKVALPFKHFRNASAGNRPSAMEVAQALNEITEEEEEETINTTPTTIPEPTSPIVSLPRFRGPLSQCQAEKRKSTFEKYSAVILPPLPEEATPTASPAGTLRVAPEPLGGHRTPEEKSTIPQDVGSRSVHQGDLPKDDETDMMSNEGEKVDFISNQLSYVKLDVDQIADLLNSRAPLPQQSDDTQTISVELLSIVGNAVTVISEPGMIFYDSEILAVVHRVKSKASGLASTSVWCWLGKQSRLGDREDKKLQELSRRYGTRAKIVHQLAEPTELIQIVGGRLAIRQGSRRHWTSDNTTMHLVRSCRGVILIDEHDFSIKNMCSAFSYCFSLLGSIYVWHGCGSTPKEREASIEYAHILSPDPLTPTELFEERNDEDEIFWMMLGDEEFAKADYWRWRQRSDYDPQMWKVDTSNPANPVVPVEFISMEQQIQTSVYVVNCIWELFVLVGKNARGRRACIRCALDLAKTISSETASDRPYRPTIHVLVLPSQVPIDLRLGIRDLDEAWLNEGEVPDYMNLIPCPPAGGPDQLENSPNLLVSPPLSSYC